MVDTGSAGGHSLLAGGIIGFQSRHSLSSDWKIGTIVFVAHQSAQRASLNNHAFSSNLGYKYQ